MATRTVLRLLLVAFLLVPASGCFVGEEMDKAAAIAKVPDKSAKPDAAAKPGSAKPGAATAAGKPAAASGDAWWKTASSVTSEESDAEIAKCEVSGRIEFMLRDDCLSRGGVPK